LVKPGHIFPLYAKEGGVLERAGHTEGAVDLMNLAGLKPAAVLCEVMSPDGTMTKGAQLIEFAKQHKIKILSIEEIISYRMLRENLIAEEISTELPIELYGSFMLTVIKEKITGIEHVVLEKKIKKSATTLVRIHSVCLTGDLFGSLRCDCNKQLHYSLKRLGEEGGLLIYLNQEGRGIGLFNKIKAYALQEEGLDTIEANEKLGLPVDSRKYFIAANILRNHGINDVRLLTNNLAKVNDLKKYGIAKVELEAIPVFCNEHNKKYLHAKMLKLNHVMKHEC
jgi:3,4-dihydroxy 2-butanone 4-phosphate synthase/GTP cyclohydrolase II